MSLWTVEGVKEAAARENWKYSVNKDGEREYHVSNLPAITQAALFKKHGQPTLKERLSIAATCIGTRKAAAKAAGVSEATFYRYLNGESEPPLAVVVGLARASGYSCGWLATGEGPVK